MATITTRINSKLYKGKSVASIFGRLLKRPLHIEKDKGIKMVDIQNILLKKKYKI